MPHAGREIPVHTDKQVAIVDNKIRQWVAVIVHDSVLRSQIAVADQPESLSFVTKVAGGEWVSVLKRQEARQRYFLPLC